jgi:hypothetical protein
MFKPTGGRQQPGRRVQQPSRLTLEHQQWQTRGGSNGQKTVAALQLINI